MATAAALEDENLGDDILCDLDSYMDDINDRLTISRMVSDSVIKGMVNAVSQEAADVLAAKELEVARLKEALCHNHFGCGTLDASGNQDEHNFQMNDIQFFYASSNVETHSMMESLCFLTEAAKEQFERFQKYIVHTEGCNYPQLNSAPEAVGAYYSLKATLEALCQQVHGAASVYLRLDLKIREGVEAMVFSTISQSIQVDFERRVWDLDAVFDLVERFKKISIVRLELDSIQKHLVALEHGHLSSQGSQDVDHRKMLSSHVVHSGSLWDENGKREESKISMPENLETSKLNHMTKEELYQYFRTEIIKMKRDHESTVQQMTEEYFALKREFLKEKELLKERGPFAAFRKDKDSEMLRKNISDTIVKLDDILTSSEKLSEFCKHSRDTLDGLLSENYTLKGVLNDNKLELGCLSLHASDATKKLSQHSLVEDNLHKLTGHLKGCLDDAQIEAWISEDVYTCTLRDLALQNKLNCEDLDMSSVITQEIIKTIFAEVVYDAEVAIRADYVKSSDLESTLSQQISWILFEEVSKDMCAQLNELKKKCLEKDESLVILKSKALKIEKELEMEIEDKKSLNNKVSMIEKSSEVWEKSLKEVIAALQEKQQQFEVADEECRSLRIKYEALVSDGKELVLLKDNLVNCQKQIDLYENEVSKLNEELASSKSKLKKAEEEHAKFILDLEQKKLAMLVSKDREHSKSLVFVTQFVTQELSKSFANFELRMKERISWLDVRLENSAFQLNSLIPRVNILRRRGLLYRERYEKRCSDLQKAEAEVDLLGDDVDTLVSLLNKVYVALDHYSPILQHYPGILEILKLVRRQLSGEVVKAAGAAA